MDVFRICGRIASLVVALAVATAAAADNTGVRSGHDDVVDGDRDTVRLDYIPLRIGAFETTAVRRVVLVIGGRLYGTALAGRVIRRDENRIGLNNIPVIGDFTRFAYSSDLFTPQAFAGSAGLVDNALVLNIDAPADAQPWLDPATAAQLAAVLSQPQLMPAPAEGGLSVQTLVTLNTDYSYAVAGGAIQPLQVPDSAATAVPALGAIPVIGRLFTLTNTDNNTRELVVLVSPSIVE